MRERLAGALAVAMALPMLAVVTVLPRVGSPDAPVHTHVASRYLARGPAEGGAENLVTAVLLNYRGLDTFGEVVVIFTALAAAMAVLLAMGGQNVPSSRSPGANAHGTRADGSPAHGKPAHGEPMDEPPPASVPPSPVVTFIVRLVAPFIAMFGLWVIVTGHRTPGGGLQGAAILAAMFILVAMVLGTASARSLLPGRSLPWLQAAGPLAFFGVGLLGAVLTGFALGYPVDPALHLLRELMLVGVEVGIGVGGALIFASLFLALESP